MLLVAAVWLGLLLTVAGIATPAPFATLAKADAGRVVARVLAQEAAVSVVLGAVILVLQRAQTRRRAASGASPQFDLTLGLAAGAMFCTLAGYYAVQPMMADAKAGQGALGFAQLHAISGGFYVLKVVLVAVLAWRLTRPPSS